MTQKITSLDVELHGAPVESLEKKIMDLALERTGARSGAILLAHDDGLRMDFHVVEGVSVRLPDVLLRRRKDGRPNGIAFWALDHRKPYLSNDTSSDVHYAAYFHDVLSIAAAPILYQQRAIGVISVSARHKNAFTPRHLDELHALSQSAAKFLRRAQLYREEGGLIKGLSPEWLDVEKAIERVAGTNAPILVRGESGTGKELVAHAVHFNSRRREKPFVVVNAAAIPETLLESALFGHVKGAFTGATADRKGQFLRADGGTLFLDEVGDLAGALQVKLLRAVEQGEVAPLGSDEETRRVDVRLICATNRDLEAMMARGDFRPDLYYRLGVVTLRLPPLRSFRDNLPILAQIFLQQTNRRYGTDIERFSPEALSILHDHDFPGNLRELRNIVDYAALMATTPEITVAELPPQLARRPAPAPKKAGSLAQMRKAWLADQERKYLVELVEGASSMREAARRAGVSPATLYRLLRLHGIRLRVRAE